MAETLSPAQGLRVLILDEDVALTRSMSAFLKREGHDPLAAHDRPAADAALAQADDAGTPFAIAIIGVTACGDDLPEYLRVLARRHRRTAVIVLAGYPTVEHAVESLRLGACDYLVKPLVDAELRQSLTRAAHQHALQRENQALRSRLDERLDLEGIVGNDPRMRRVYDMIRAVAAGKTTVLMEGESGTGKSLIAHAIHHHGPRRDRPFVEISCGSIPETLLESELFGHVKGAFTGAHADKAGRFVAANGGTLFLDEINSASPAMQLKLLRVLQERRFEPVGGSKTVEVDVRVILASNQPLEDLVASGQFRQDLYYRVNVVKIELPPLRERLGDIQPLAERFLARFAGELGRQLVGFTPDALDALRLYRYPGNVRELQNIVERAAVLARGQTITRDDLPEAVTSPPDGPLALSRGDAAWVPRPLEEALREPEKRIILQALAANNWNRQRTSEVLGINRTTLYKKMKTYGLLDDERLAG
ncbi:MAG: sigma-54-dependent Fis family transcriptional regulator [Phycisphaerae bacterium]|nr:MAG: sigma-54-dependent Fis family transcriptional regulator [Phycisphaerae bacterium]